MFLLLKYVTRKMRIPNDWRVYLAHTGPVSLNIPINPMINKTRAAYRRDLRPDITILNHSVNGNEWRVEFNEQNDFSKLIGFAGKEQK